MHNIASNINIKAIRLFILLHEKSRSFAERTQTVANFPFAKGMITGAENGELIITPGSRELIKKFSKQSGMRWIVLGVMGIAPLVIAIVIILRGTLMGG